MNIWSSHITRLLDVAGGGEWVWAQSGWQGKETGLEWVAGSDRGSGPSWGWQQAAQWMKAGQVMCGWEGGTLLLLKQMPWLLGLISPAKHHLPALAKNKLKHLWSVSVFLLASMQRRSAFWLGNRLHRELPEALAIIVYFSALSTFSLLLSTPFHTPSSIFHQTSSWLFFVVLFPSILHFPSAARNPAAVKTEDVVRGWGAQRNCEQRRKSSIDWLSVALLALVDLIWDDYSNAIATNHCSAHPQLQK